MSFDPNIKKSPVPVGARTGLYFFRTNKPISKDQVDARQIYPSN